MHASQSTRQRRGFAEKIKQLSCALIFMEIGKEEGFYFQVAGGRLRRAKLMNRGDLLGRIRDLRGAPSGGRIIGTLRCMHRRAGSSKALHAGLRRGGCDRSGVVGKNGLES